MDTMEGTVAGGGWYPDPWGPGQLRWWDGAAWSAHTRPMPPLPPRPVDSMSARAWLPAVGGTVALLVATRVLAAVGADHAHAAAARDAVLVAFYVAIYGGLFLLVRSLVRRHASGSVWRDLGVRFQWSDLGFGPLLFVVARIAQAAVVVPFVASSAIRSSSRHYSHALRSEPTFGLVVLAVVGILVAPVVEELLFRGLIMRSLTSRIGSVGAAVAQGVLFGLYHFSPSLGLYNLMLLTANSTFGVIFGFVARRRRSLCTGMVAHAITNASVVLVILISR